MYTYLSTSLVGGHDGSMSSDILYMCRYGNLVLNDTARNKLNTSYAIQQIAISSGWIVDGLSVTYQVSGGGTSTFNHGSTFDPPTYIVSFGTNELLTAVFGRAGYQTYYDRDMINNVGFVIFNTDGETNRIAGPFGNGDESNEGQPFWASDVLAFGSFAEDSSTVGLSGLFFHKNSSRG